jgi:hypothetical protein
MTLKPKWEELPQQAEFLTCYQGAWFWGVNPDDVSSVSFWRNGVDGEDMANFKPYKIQNGIEKGRWIDHFERKPTPPDPLLLEILDRVKSIQAHLEGDGK